MYTFFFVEYNLCIHCGEENERKTLITKLTFNNSYNTVCTYKLTHANDRMFYYTKINVWIRKNTYNFYYR